MGVSRQYCGEISRQVIYQIAVSLSTASLPVVPLFALNVRGRPRVPSDISVTTKSEIACSRCVRRWHQAWHIVLAIRPLFE